MLSCSSCAFEPARRKPLLLFFFTYLAVSCSFAGCSSRGCEAGCSSEGCPLRGCTSTDGACPKVERRCDTVTAEGGGEEGGASGAATGSGICGFRGALKLSG